MYAILIWSDLEGDFIEFKHQEKVRFNTYTEAAEFADLVARETGEQTKVQFVRNVKGPKKQNRSGRLQRFRAVQFDGEWVRVVATLENGKVSK